MPTDAVATWGPIEDARALMQDAIAQAEGIAPAHALDAARMAAGMVTRDADRGQLVTAWRLWNRLRWACQESTAEDITTRAGAAVLALI